MSSLKSFFKKFPLVYAAFGLALILAMLNFIPVIPGWKAGSGIREVIMAVIVLAVWGLIQGRKALRPDFTGTKYGFRLIRYMFILYCVFIVISVVGYIRNKTQFAPGTVLNLVLAALSVGIVEEFTCRGMIFGGLCHAFGGKKKGVLWAAVISSFLFGFIHVFNELFAGSEYSAERLLQMFGKTLQAGLIGFGFAMLYIKTRNIWAVAALHSLNDALIFIYSADSPIIGKYVQTGVNGKAASFGYLFFILFSLPFLINTVRELRKEPEPLVCPLDDEFTPRAPVFVPRKKKKDAK